MVKTPSITHVFKKGDRCFAKFKGSPYWPARVEATSKDLIAKKKYNILFYGTYQTSVAKIETLEPYNEETKNTYGQPKKLKSFMEGLWEIEHDPSLKKKHKVKQEPENTSQELMDESVEESTTTQDSSGLVNENEDTNNSSSSSRKGVRKSSRIQLKDDETVVVNASSKTTKPVATSITPSPKTTKSDDESNDSSQRSTGTARRSERVSASKLLVQQTSFDSTSNKDNSEVLNESNGSLDTKSSKGGSEVDVVMVPRTSGRAKKTNRKFSSQDRSPKGVAKKFGEDKQKKVVAGIESVDKLEDGGQIEKNMDAEVFGEEVDGVEEPNDGLKKAAIEADDPLWKEAEDQSMEIDGADKITKPHVATELKLEMEEGEVIESPNKEGEIVENLLEEEKEEIVTEKLTEKSIEPKEVEISETDPLNDLKIEVCKEKVVDTPGNKENDEEESTESKTTQIKHLDEKLLEQKRLKRMAKNLEKKKNYINSIQIQNALALMNKEIKASLTVAHQDKEKCCFIMEDLLKLPFKQRHLFNSPEIVETIRRVTKYKDGLVVKNLAIECYNKFRCMFSLQQAFSLVFEREREKFLADNLQELKKERVVAAQLAEMMSGSSKRKSAKVNRDSLPDAKRTKITE